MLLRVALLLAAALLAAPARSAEVEEMSAALLESSTTSGKLVLFYDGGAASARALAVLAQLAAEDAARGLQYIKVDSRSEMNADAVREAEFGGKYPQVFINTESGVDDFFALRDEFTAAAARFEVEFAMSGPQTPGRVRQLSAERDLGGAQRAVVAYSVRWCHACTRARQHLSEASARTPGVDFFEVDCAESAESAAFCEARGAKTFPVVDLIAPGTKAARYAGKLSGHALTRWLTAEGGHGEL